MDEPKIRKDGKCFICQKPRPEVAIKEGDPFCTSECCKSYFSTDDSTDVGARHTAIKNINTQKGRKVPKPKKRFTAVPESRRKRKEH